MSTPLFIRTPFIAAAKGTAGGAVASLVTYNTIVEPLLIEEVLYVADDFSTDAGWIDVNIVNPSGDEFSAVSILSVAGAAGTQAAGRITVNVVLTAGWGLVVRHGINQSDHSTGAQVAFTALGGIVR